MENFFWGAFGVFFIIASLVGLLTLLSMFFDWLWVRKSLKKYKAELVEKESKKDSKE